MLSLSEKTELRKDLSFHQLIETAMFSHAVQLTLGNPDPVPSEKARQLALSIIQNAGSAVFVQQAVYMLACRADTLFPECDTKDKILDGLRSGGLVPLLDAAFATYWEAFAQVL